MDSSSSDDEDLGVLASGFSFQAEDEPEVNEDENQAEENNFKPSLPLFSLSEVEALVIENRDKELDAILSQIKSMINEDIEKNPTVQLQVHVLSMAVSLAKGDFFDVLKSPVIAPIIARYNTRDRSIRVKNRVDRYLSGEVMTFILDGLRSKIEKIPDNSMKDEDFELSPAEAQGDPAFKEPNHAGPDVHVSQRVLRCAACMFAGAACLGLYQQANWTGPPLNEDHLKALYPLPFVQGIYDGEKKKTKLNVEEMEALKLSQGDAKSSSAITGKDVKDIQVDKFQKLHVYTSKKLEANGEPIYRDSKYVHYLHMSRILLRTITKPTLKVSSVDPDDFLPEEAVEAGVAGAAKPRPPPEKVSPLVRWAVTQLQTANWWAARSTTCHHETLESKKASAPSLKLEMDTCFTKTMEMKLLENPFLNARAHLEWGLCLHKFGDADGVKEKLEISKQKAELEVGLTGALGKRTKFQEESKSQLILLAKSKSTKADDGRAESDDEAEKANAEEEQEKLDPEDPRASELGKTKVLGIRTIRLTELDEYTPLREKIKFTDSEKDSLERSGRLSELDQSIVLGLCVDVKNSYAMEALTAEEMSAYVERVMQHPQNWMIYSTSLMIKSQLEYERTKTKERAVLQMQLLVDQQSNRLTPLQATQKEIDDSAPVSERLRWLSGLAWPALWNLKRGLASRYLSMGVAASALKICEEVFLWEEAVDCLLAMDKKARAIKLVKERLEIQPTANLYCQMGILTQEVEWFEKGWEFSSKRYSRAKRLWGLAMYEMGDHAAAIEHYQEALKINPLVPHAWYRVGVAAMKCQNWKAAKHAFIQVTSQEPKEAESWANLCAVYDKMEMPDAALQAIKEAVKHQRNNWKIWENYLTFALRQKEWTLALDALNSLIDLRVGLGGKSKKDGVVDVPALVVIVEALISENQMAQLLPDDENVKDGTDVKSVTLRNNHFLVQKLVRLFQRIKAECKSDPNVWKIMGVFFKWFQDRQNYRDCLIRRVRSLQSPDWAEDENRAAKVVKAVTEAVKAYVEDSKEHPGLKREAEMLAKNTVERVEKAEIGLEQIENLKQYI